MPGLIPPDATASLPVHPTQLYSAIDGLILLLLLSAYYPLRRRDGEVMGLLMVTYPDHPLPDRVSPQRRGRLLRRADDLAEHQRRCSWPAGSLYWVWLWTLPAEAAIADERGTRSAADGRVDARWRTAGLARAWPHGTRDVVEDAAEEVVGGEPLGVGLVADDDPVAEDVAGQAS